jgi:hypothetical protein
MKSIVHAFAGTLAMFCIAGFMIATLVSEVFMGPSEIVLVKRAILYSLLLFLPMLVITGGSGFYLAISRVGVLVDQKKRNMRIIGITGLMVLLPSAFFLHHKATAGEYDALFYIFQILEILAGGNNLRLMLDNMIKGLRLAGRLRPNANRIEPSSSAAR